MTNAEFAVAADSTNSDLQLLLAKERAEYLFTKKYAVSTAAQQAGLTPEEKAAAEKAASGAPKQLVKKVAIDPKEADDLKAQLEKQRAEEQRLREEAVKKANEELEAEKKKAAEL